MAAPIPPTLRVADIARFALRAGQLEKAKPIIAYWCNYWIVNQILAKSLHTSDDESMTYTMRLVDKLEQTKADHGEDDAIKNDVAAQAYVEHFGSETFQRADNAMKLDKASRQTADTFQAAATFLELCQIWGSLEPEIASKIKFAKYHALRIVRAIKAGEDPNLSNPTPELSPVREIPPITEAELQNTTNVKNLENTGYPSYQSSVEDVVDEHDRSGPRLARGSEIDESLRSPSKSRITNQDSRNKSEGPSPPIAEDYYHNSTNSEVSPLKVGPSDPDGGGGGYFPHIPNKEGIVNSLDPAAMPSKDQFVPPSASSPYISPPSYPQAPNAHPTSSLHSFPPPPPPPPQTDQTPYTQIPHPNQPSIPRNPQGLPPQPPQQPQPTKQFDYNPHPTRPFEYPQSTQPSTAPPAPPTQISHVPDEEAMMKAQKHARFAISALNFEDVKTAILELRGALESLGAG